MALNPLLEIILSQYSKDDHYIELLRARDHFKKLTGSVAVADDDFENQTKRFIDWFLFERKLEKAELCPVKLYLWDVARPQNVPDLDRFEQLAQSLHSLFRCLRCRRGDVFVEDVFTGDKYLVEDLHINQGFNKKEIFDARIIPQGDRYHFGDAFAFHPVECAPIIMKRVKALGYLGFSHRLALMHKLIGLKIKATTYSHVTVESVYDIDFPI